MIKRPNLRIHAEEEARIKINVRNLINKITAEKSPNLRKQVGLQAQEKFR